MFFKCECKKNFSDISYKNKQKNQDFKTFLVFQKIQTLRKHIEKIEAARPLKLKKNAVRLLFLKDHSPPLLLLSGIPGYFQSQTYPQYQWDQKLYQLTGCYHSAPERMVAHSLTEYKTWQKN